MFPNQQHDFALEEKLKNLKVGDSLRVQRETIYADDHRCPSEVESVKKVRELIPVPERMEKGRVLIVWGTGTNRRVHNMSLSTGCMFGGLNIRPTRYRVFDVVSSA